jgi:hypothetical protein
MKKFQGEFSSKTGDFRCASKKHPVFSKKALLQVAYTGCPKIGGTTQWGNVKLC